MRRVKDSKVYPTLRIEVAGSASFIEEVMPQSIFVDNGGWTENEALSYLRENYNMLNWDVEDADGYNASKVWSADTTNGVVFIAALQDEY